VVSFELFVKLKAKNSKLKTNFARGRGVMGARGGRIAEMRVRFPSSPFCVAVLMASPAARDEWRYFHNSHPL
jgi:hypothetical protein